MLETFTSMSLNAFFKLMFVSAGFSLFLCSHGALLLLCWLVMIREQYKGKNWFRDLIQTTFVRVMHSPHCTREHREACGTPLPPSCMWWGSDPVSVPAERLAGRPGVTKGLLLQTQPTSRARITCCCSCCESQTLSVFLSARCCDCSLDLWRISAHSSLSGEAQMPSLSSGLFCEFNSVSGAVC